MAWVRTIEPEDAEGELKAEYERAIGRAGRVANVLKISSLHPTALKRWVQLYQAVMFKTEPLSRSERELVATVVSQENGCHY